MKEKILSAEEVGRTVAERALKKQAKEERKHDKAVKKTANWLIKRLVRSDKDYIKVKQTRLNRKLGRWGDIYDLSKFLEHEGYAAYAEKFGKYFYLSTEAEAISDFIADDVDLEEGFDYFDEEED